MMRRRSDEILAARLAARSELTPSGCREWRGHDNHGYGIMWDGALNQRVHRLAWELANGPIPAEMKICHRCDNRRCLNVDHLFLGTQAQNMLDMTIKGRRTQGESHGRAKLTENQVREIRVAPGPQRAIAARFDIAQSAVWEIKNGQRWRHLAFDKGEK